MISGLLLVLAACLWAMGTYAYFLVPKIAHDKKAYKNTIATFLGQKGTLTLCTICYLTSSLIAGGQLGTAIYGIGIMYLLLMRFSFQQKTDVDLQNVYRWFLLVNVVSIIILSISVIAIWK